MTPPTATGETRTARYRAPALEKGLDILEALAGRPEGLTQTEIARVLDRSVSEIFRMLACLVERGYLVIRRPEDRYVLTLKLFELAHRNAPRSRMLAEALPIMRAYANDVHQSCHLVVSEAGRGVVLAQVDSPGEMGFAVRSGAVIDLRTTASGRVLLAFADADTRARMLAESGDARSDDAALDRRLAQIRARGFEEMESSRLRGVHDVSFPVYDHSRISVAALTSPFIERLDRPSGSTVTKAREALGAAAGRLCLAIGGLTAVTAAGGTKV